jgi:capsular polysaccharide biosynthesis protein
MTNDDRTTIDVSDWMRTFARYWWIVVGLTILGAVAGGLLTLASPKQYTATSSAYIGQTTDANGNPMAGLNNNPKASQELLNSQLVLDEAAKRTGMGETASKLRRDISVATPSQTVKASGSVVNIVDISVTDAKKVRATKAANQLAAVLLEHIGVGAEQKVALLTQQLAAGQKQLAASQARTVAAQNALESIAAGGGSETQKAAAAAPYVAIVEAGANVQQSYINTNQQTARLLLTAQQVELPRLVHPAALPDSPSGPDLRLNVAAGALAGLVIGIIVAFVWRRLAER